MGDNMNHKQSNENKPARHRPIFTLGNDFNWNYPEKYWPVIQAGEPPQWLKDTVNAAYKSLESVFKQIAQDGEAIWNTLRDILAAYGVSEVTGKTAFDNRAALNALKDLIKLAGCTVIGDFLLTALGILATIVGTLLLWAAIIWCILYILCVHLKSDSPLCCRIFPDLPQCQKAPIPRKTPRPALLPVPFFPHREEVDLRSTTYRTDQA